MSTPLPVPQPPSSPYSPGSFHTVPCGGAACGLGVLPLPRHLGSRQPRVTWLMAVHAHPLCAVYLWTELGCLGTPTGWACGRAQPGALVGSILGPLRPGSRRARAAAVGAHERLKHQQSGPMSAGSTSRCPSGPNTPFSCPACEQSSLLPGGTLHLGATSVPPLGRWLGASALSQPTDRGQHKVTGFRVGLGAQGAVLARPAHHAPSQGCPQGAG